MTSLFSKREVFTFEKIPETAFGKEDSRYPLEKSGDRHVQLLGDDEQG